jgi:hypothetical protein
MGHRNRRKADALFLAAAPGVLLLIKLGICCDAMLHRFEQKFNGRHEGHICQENRLDCIVQAKPSK